VYGVLFLNCVRQDLSAKMEAGRKAQAEQSEMMPSPSQAKVVEEIRE